MLLSKLPAPWRMTLEELYAFEQSLRLAVSSATSSHVKNALLAIADDYRAYLAKQQRLKD